MAFAQSARLVVMEVQLACHLHHALVNALLDSSVLKAQQVQLQTSAVQSTSIALLDRVHQRLFVSNTIQLLLKLLLIRDQAKRLAQQDTLALVVLVLSCMRG